MAAACRAVAGTTGGVFAGVPNAYKTNTGSVVDQYGNRVPTGSYVNSAGKTITYTKD